MFLELLNRAGEHLLHQPVNDLDPRQVALVHRPVRRLPGKGLVVQRAVRVAIKEAADFVLQLVDTLNRQLAKPPGHVLIRQPFAADHRVHEVALHCVARPGRDIISALHHARAAGFADQPFHRDGDLRIGCGLLRMQGAKQSRTARAEDQDVRVVGLKLHGRSPHPGWPNGTVRGM